MSEKQLSFNELGIEVADIYRQMGYGEATPDDQVRVETDRLMDEIGSWLRPRFCYFVDSQLPATFNTGQTISRQLDGAEAYAFFIATAGIEYEAYQQRLKQEGDMVRTYIADALGSVIAEACADQMECHLQASIDKLQWKHTNRFSPGYCGWSVTQQQLLFPLFRGHTCGVRLNDSSLMLPIKSVSGIIGLGRNVSRKDYACHLCNQEQCYKRKKWKKKSTY
ncbi:MAG: methionine synthase [Prevotella sp.]|nr:methionine synthase [Prevotella sp.]